MKEHQSKSEPLTPADALENIPKILEALPTIVSEANEGRSDTLSYAIHDPNEVKVTYMGLFENYVDVMKNLRAKLREEHDLNGIYDNKASDSIHKSMQQLEQEMALMPCPKGGEHIYHSSPLHPPGQQIASDPMEKTCTKCDFSYWI
ncbi:MAG: hypothetical protein GY861_08560 [bacterium]|nr:hypothetical protein [bacterium]